MKEDYTYDEHFVHSIRDGDEKAFLKLYENEYKKLCVYLLNYTQDRQVIEDIVQDTFYKLWAQRKTLVITKSLNSYLFRSVYNHFVDNYRKEKKKTSLVDEYLQKSIDDYHAYETAYKEQLLKKLHQCIELLPDKCKEVFIQVKIKGMRYKDVSLALNISQKTIEGHIRKGYGFIKDCVRPAA